MHFASDPVGQVLLLSAFLLEKGDISSLLNIVILYLRYDQIPKDQSHQLQYNIVKNF
jgi:hypothetical protein